MKNIIRFAAFFLALFAAAVTTNAQSTPSTAPFAVFQAENQDDYRVPTLPSNPSDGRHVLAMHKTNGTKVIAVVRGGKIASIGYQPVGGSFIAVSPNSGAPCVPSGFCYSWQIKKCFPIPGGGCVCVCGTWITT